MQNVQLISYGDKNYIVAETTKKESVFVIDESSLNLLKQNILPKKTLYISSGYVTFKLNNKTTLLHRFVSNADDEVGKSVDHINRIKTDNRLANLRFVSQSEQNKNQKKKKRNTELPENSGIDINQIPNFIYYMPPYGNHGERWYIEIDKYEWKTTSKKDISIKCKYEIAKKHLRELKKQHPQMVESRSFNGSLLDDNATKLKNDYINIIKLAGYVYNENNIVDTTLDEDINSLSQIEKDLYNNTNFIITFEPKIREYTRKNNLPENCGVNIEDIPKHCYYIKADSKKGDGFCVDKHHPKQLSINKDWKTSRSKLISTKIKFDQMMDYIN